MAGFFLGEPFTYTFPAILYVNGSIGKIPVAVGGFLLRFRHIRTAPPAQCGFFTTAFFSGRYV